MTSSTPAQKDAQWDDAGLAQTQDAIACETQFACETQNALCFSQSVFGHAIVLCTRDIKDSVYEFAFGSFIN